MESRNRLNLNFPDLILVFTFYYIFVAVIFSWLQGNEKIHWASLYFLVAFTSLLVLFSKSLFTYRKNTSIKNQKLNVRYLTFRDYVRYILAIGVFAALWFSRNNNIIAWFDEATQFFTGNFSMSKWHVTEYAAIQQQPPIDYYLSAFARDLLGPNLIAVRFHSFAFSALIVVLTVYTSLRKKIPFWIFFPWLFFFLGQAEVSQYMVEAMPIALGMFFSFLVFLYTDQNKNPTPKDRVGLTSSAFLLLMSLGFQSSIFLVSLAISQSFTRSKREIYYIWTHAVLLPGLLCTPIRLYIIGVSKELDQFHGADTIRNVLMTTLNEIKKKVLFLLEVGEGAWIALLMVLGISLIFTFQKRSSKVHVHNVIATIIFGSVYPILALFIWSSINWPLYHRYVTLWISGSAFLLLSLLASTKQLAFRSFVGLFFIIHIFILAFYFISDDFWSYQKFRQSRLYGARPNWNEFVKEIDRLDVEEIKFIYLSTSDRPSNDMHFLTGRIFETTKSRWAYIGYHNDRFFCSYQGIMTVVILMEDG